MLRPRRKYQETLVRLKNISKRSQDFTLKKGCHKVPQEEISTKGHFEEVLGVIKDFGYLQEITTNDSKIYNTPELINLNSREDVMTYFEEKNYEVNNKTVDLEAHEEDTNTPTPVTQTTFRTFSYSLNNLPLFQRKSTRLNSSH